MLTPVSKDFLKSIVVFISPQPLLTPPVAKMASLQYFFEFPVVYL